MLLCQWVYRFLVLQSLFFAAIPLSWSSFAELSKAKKNLDSMKAQAESVSTEYDRLLAEKDKLERKLKIAGVGAGDEGTKKDD